jgi:hypothetical protein
MQNLVGKFWRWLYNLAERRIRAHHMSSWGHDRRCPNCGRWGALYGWSRKEDVDYMHIALTCRACNHTSVWLEDSMAPMPVDPVTFQPLSRHPMANLESNNKR